MWVESWKLNHVQQQRHFVWSMYANAPCRWKPTDDHHNLSFHARAYVQAWEAGKRGQRGGNPAQHQRLATCANSSLPKTCWGSSDCAASRTTETYLLLHLPPSRAVSPPLFHRSRRHFKVILCFHCCCDTSVRRQRCLGKFKFVKKKNCRGPSDKNVTGGSSTLLFSTNAPRW